MSAKTVFRAGGSLFAAALLAAAQGHIARPGTVNYAEGNVSLDGQFISAPQLGSTELQPGQILSTGNGRAEVLLTPGAFLRVASDSEVEMLSPSLTNTSVRLAHGKALVEVDQIQKENNLNVAVDGTVTRLLQPGIYELSANPPLLLVYDGKAVVETSGRAIEVATGSELPLEQYAAGLNPRTFDRNNTDELIAWSKLRSEYMAQANASAAQSIIVNSPAWYAGTGWYWDPAYGTWAFVPGAGLVESPWGYGFYSPSYWSYGFYGAPYYFGGFGGHHHHHGDEHFGFGHHGAVASHPGFPMGHQHGGAIHGGAIASQPVPPMGGSGLRFGGAASGMHAPAMQAPSAHMAAPMMQAPSAHMAAPMMHGPSMAPPMGGSGLHFGGGRR